MTYQTQALATTGLVGLWMLTDASGATTAADASTSNLPLTYSAAKTNGLENVSGAGLGMSQAVWASRAVAAGSTLAPTAAETLAVWVTPSSLPATGAILAGRTNHMRLMLNSNGQLGVQAWIGGTVRDLRIPNWMTAATAYFLAAAYTGTTLRLFVNGVTVHEMIVPGVLPTTSDVFQVGTATSPIPGTISGVAVWNRALDAGEVFALWLAGTKVTSLTSGIVVDNTYDAAGAVVSGAAAGPRCGVCHGARRTNEPAVVRGTAYNHPGCYAAKALNRTVAVPTAATPFADYEGVLLRVMHLLMQSQTERVTSLARPVYFDGSRFQPAGTPGLTANFDVYGQFGLTPALIAHHAKLPAEHWMVQLAVSQVERLWALQDPTTGNIVETSGGTGGADFVLGQLGEAILYLGPLVLGATLTRWRANYVKLGNYFLNYPAGKPESQFYVNGNREAFELWGYWMLYMVTNDPKWQAVYETQYAFLVAPPDGAGFADSAGNSTFGWVTVTAPTQADGSDGKGYLIERTGSHVGAVTGPGGTVLDGYDPNYSNLCNSALARLYTYNKDARVLRLLNMQWNLVLDRVNTTTMILDGTNGSRQNNTSSFGTPATAVLAMVAGQTRVTPTFVAAAFNELVRYLTTDLLIQSTINRDLNTTAGAWLTALPTWKP